MVTGGKIKMRTVRTKVYKFSELSKEAKKKAVEKYWDINTDYDQWADPIIEGAEEDLRDAGFNNVKVMYSGFGSQGDGACFICDSIDFSKFLNGKYKDFATEISATITHTWRYYFATSTTVNLEIQTDGIVDEDYREIEKAIEDER